MSDTNVNKLVGGIRRLYPFGFLLALISVILMFLVQDLFWITLLSLLACAGLIAAALWMQLRFETSNPKLAKIIEYAIVVFILAIIAWVIMFYLY